MYNLDKIIYLDYASTTPTDPRVVEAMLPYFTSSFGNAASRTHYYGQYAKEAVNTARKDIAKLIHAEREGDIVFTSGATEAINLALIGMFEAVHPQPFHIITCVTEHQAVLDTCAHLESKGAEVTYLPVDQNGWIDLQMLRDSIRPSTKLISIMYVNNETGVIQPISEIGQIAEDHSIYFMTDATQALGKVEINVVKQKIDLLACSAHKIYGPNGVGALYINRGKITRSNLKAHIHGGGHEGGFRSGTLNTPAIVGFGTACKIAISEIEAESAKIRELTNQLQTGLSSLTDYVHNIDTPSWLPNILSFRFGLMDAEAIIIQVKNKLALSNGSACTSEEIKPSHVIQAMKGSDDIAYATLRLSIGRFTTESEIDQTVEVFTEALDGLKAFT